MNRICITSDFCHGSSWPILLHSYFMYYSRIFYDTTVSHLEYQKNIWGTETWHQTNKDVHKIITELTFLRFFIHSTLQSDPIWRHRSRSILAQVVANYLTAPKQYRNQYLPIDKGMHSSERFVINNLGLPTCETSLKFAFLYLPSELTNDASYLVLGES